MAKLTHHSGKEGNEMNKKRGVMGLCFILFFVVLGLNKLAISAEVIVDNGGPGTSFEGGWPDSGGTPYYGSRSVYSKDPAGTYTYTATVSDTGLQEVSMWWTEWRSRCTEVLVDISDGVYPLETVTINQQDDGGKWNILGSYVFTTGTAKVVINAQGGCSTNADAVKFSGSDSGPVVGTSLDDIPSRIAGDPGVVSGDWTIPYTDAGNATDGDFSTYASGSILIGNGYITWDMGQNYDASMITVEAEIVGPSQNFIHTLGIEGSQDNANWIKLNSDDANMFFYRVPQKWYEKSRTFLSRYRVRYIRIRCSSQTDYAGVGEFRIYEVKVR